jgi:hypothetical protein
MHPLREAMGAPGWVRLETLVAALKRSLGTAPTKCAEHYHRDEDRNGAVVWTMRDDDTRCVEAMAASDNAVSPGMRPVGSWALERGLTSPPPVVADEPTVDWLERRRGLARRLHAGHENLDPHIRSEHGAPITVGDEEWRYRVEERCPGWLGRHIWAEDLNQFKPLQGLEVLVSKDGAEALRSDSVPRRSYRPTTWWAIVAWKLLEKTGACLLDDLRGALTKRYGESFSEDK